MRRSSPAQPELRRLMLDAGPLGRLTSPNASGPVNAAVARWFREQLAAGAIFYLPEVADYEVRREMIRAKRTKGLSRLDALARRIKYEPLDTPTMRHAAELWAEAQNRGTPTADPKELDGDVILAAQARKVGAVVVTENVGHLAQFVSARRWQDIPAEPEGCDAPASAGSPLDGE